VQHEPHGEQGREHLQRGVVDVDALAPGGSAAFARLDSSVMIIGPTIAAALHAVNSAP
jgi:hypothetical protein